MEEGEVKFFHLFFFKKGRHLSASYLITTHFHAHAKNLLLQCAENDDDVYLSPKQPGSLKILGW